MEFGGSRGELDSPHCFLICENGIAYLESSKKMVGVYDEKDSSIRQMYGVEYDEYYGSSDVDSDEDELPV